MKSNKRTGYDLTNDQPMSCSVAAAAGFLHDGMGTLEHDVCPIIDTLIGMDQTAPFQGLSAEDVGKAFDACWLGEGRLGMTTMASRYRAMSGEYPELALALRDMDLSTHVFIFGQTSTGMTSSHMRPIIEREVRKQRSKHTRNKPRR